MAGELSTCFGAVHGILEGVRRRENIPRVVGGGRLNRTGQRAGSHDFGHPPRNAFIRLNHIAWSAALGQHVDLLSTARLEFSPPCGYHPAHPTLQLVSSLESSRILAVVEELSITFSDVLVCVDGEDTVVELLIRMRVNKGERECSESRPSSLTTHEEAQVNEILGELPMPGQRTIPREAPDRLGIPLSKYRKTEAEAPRYAINIKAEREATIYHAVA